MRKWTANDCRIVKDHPRGIAYMQNIQPALACDDCGEPHRIQKPEKKKIREVRGAHYDDHYPLLQFKLANGETCTEFIQDCRINDEGTVVIIGLRIDKTGYEIRWTEEEIGKQLLALHEEATHQERVKEIGRKVVAKMREVKDLITEMDPERPIPPSAVGLLDMLSRLVEDRTEEEPEPEPEPEPEAAAEAAADAIPETVAAE